MNETVASRFNLYFSHPLTSEGLVFDGLRTEKSIKDFYKESL